MAGTRGQSWAGASAEGRLHAPFYLRWQGGWGRARAAAAAGGSRLVDDAPARNGAEREGDVVGRHHLHGGEIRARSGREEGERSARSARDQREIRAGGGRDQREISARSGRDERLPLHAGTGARASGRRAAGGGRLGRSGEIRLRAREEVHRLVEVLELEDRGATEHRQKQVGRLGGARAEHPPPWGGRRRAPEATAGLLKMLRRRSGVRRRGLSLRMARGGAWGGSSRHFSPAGARARGGPRRRPRGTCR